MARVSKGESGYEQCLEYFPISDRYRRGFCHAWLHFITDFAIATPNETDLPLSEEKPTHQRCTKYRFSKKKWSFFGPSIWTIKFKHDHRTNCFRQGYLSYKTSLLHFPIIPAMARNLFLNEKLVRDEEIQNMLLTWKLYGYQGAVMRCILWMRTSTTIILQPVDDAGRRRLDCEEDSWCDRWGRS